MRYDVFDMRVEADREFPFPAAAGEGAVDCRLAEDEALVERVEADRTGVLRDEGCELQYGGWLCEVRPGEGRVSYARRPLGELELPLWHVLERMVLPLYATLAATERLCLHASGVVLDGLGWLFIGDTGAGKSTTAFELARNFDARLASDEMAVVDVERGDLLVGSPGVRLLPGQVDGGAVDSGTIHPALEKHWFRLPNNRLARGRAPLGGLVVLERVDEPDSPEPASFSEVAGSRRLTLLLEQTFEFEEAPRSWRERRFRNAAALAKSTQMHACRIHPSEDGTPAHVDSLCDMLMGEFRA